MRTYTALYTLDMNANMTDYFISHRNKRDYVIFIRMGNDIEQTSINAIHATHLSHIFDNHLEMWFSTPHFAAEINALHFFQIN